MERKPVMYDAFHCIGGECPMTCCQQWKIAVDEDTFKKWKKTKAPLVDGTQLAKNLSFYTTMKEGGRVIMLDRDKKCPFLNKEKLCTIVLRDGDEMLSNTCQIFPREVHEYEGFKEYTLMPSCPAVIDLLMKMEEPMKLVGDEEGREEAQRDALREIRDRFMNIMAEKSITPEAAFLTIFYLAGFLLEKEELFWTKEMEEEVKKAVLRMETDPVETFDERCEIFLDLAENYRKEGLYVRFLEPAAEQAEEYLSRYEEDGADISDEEVMDDLEAFAQVWKQHRPLMRKLLLEEIWADTIVPDGTLEDMVMKLQWISMEFAAIAAAAFLSWKKDGELTYEAVRECINVICRMTGYDEDDIREYLENSFEALIWEFGYAALIVSK